MRRDFLLIRTKKELLFNLYEKGYTADDLREVFWLIDQMMRLTRDFAKILKRELISYEKEKAMPYITSIERLGIEEGMKKGMETGTENVLVKLAKKRFGSLESGTESRIRALSMNDLEALADAILDFETLDQLRSWLEERG